MSKRYVLIAIVVIGCVAGVLWQRQHSSAKAARVEAEILKELSADQIELILENQAKVDGPSVMTISSSIEKRRAFLDGMKQYLALAAQARREGLDEDPTFKTNFAYKRDVLLHDMYRAKLSEGQTNLYAVPAEQVKTYLSDSNHLKEF